MDSPFLHERVVICRRFPCGPLPPRGA